jgi:hypothetical protein
MVRKILHQPLGHQLGRADRDQHGVESCALPPQPARAAESRNRAGRYRSRASPSPPPPPTGVNGRRRREVRLPRDLSRLSHSLRSQLHSSVPPCPLSMPSDFRGYSEPPVCHGISQGPRYLLRLLAHRLILPLLRAPAGEITLVARSMIRWSLREPTDCSYTRC